MVKKKSAFPTEFYIVETVDYDNEIEYTLYTKPQFKRAYIEDGARVVHITNLPEVRVVQNHRELLEEVPF